MIDQHAFKLLTLVGARLLVVTGTVVYRWLEDWSWVDSVYFSVVAMTTVGFGDLTPTTDASKVFTIGYLVVGVSLFTTFSTCGSDTGYQGANKLKARKQG